MTKMKNKTSTSRTSTSKSYSSSPTKTATTPIPLASHKSTNRSDNTTKRTANAMPYGKKK